MSNKIKNKPQNLQQMLQSAISHQNAGNPQQAEKLYKEILSHAPDQPHVLNLYGILAISTHRHKLAESLFRKAVSIQPNMPDFNNNLALVLDETGNIDEAGKFYNKTLELKPDFCDAHYNYANLLLRTCQYTPAIEHYKKALNVNPSYADAYNNLGRALFMNRDYVQAEAAYKKALGLQPGMALAYCNLGQLYLTLGKTDEAVSAYQEAIRIAPAYAKPYGSLAYIRKCTSPNDDLIIDIENLLARGKCNAEETIQLHFSLGKLYDDCGQYDRAFSNFKKANDLKSAMVKFNPQKFQEEIDSIISLYTRSFIEQHRQFGDFSSRPVFVVGMPRSGTSLVEQIIASHPLAAGLGELLFFSEQAGLIRDQLLQSLAYWSRADQKAYAEVASKYLELLAGQVSEDKQRVVDKMPYNYLNLGLISTLFPNASIIHCKRDPTDTCFSIYCNDFGGRHEYTSLLSDIGLYYRQYQRLMNHWGQVLPERILDIEYEKLIANQEKTSRQLIQYIGLPWDDKCLEFYRNKRAVNTRSTLQVRQPIYKNSIRRWKHYEKHLGSLINILG